MADALSIKSVETFVVSLPARRPHLWVGLTSPAGHGYLVVKLELTNGSIGWGEAQAIPTWGGDDASRYGETPTTARHLIEEHLVPALRNVDLRQFENVHTAMNRVVRGHPYAKAAIDVAVMDAVGHSLNVPVYQLLGGRVRDRIAVAHSIGLMEVDAAVDEAVRVVDEGVKTLKVKIGVEVERSATSLISGSMPIKAIGPGAKLSPRSIGWPSPGSFMPSSSSTELTISRRFRRAAMFPSWPMKASGPSAT